MKNKLRIVYLLSFIIMFSGCKINYSFSGGSIDPNIKSISIQYFPNNALLIQPKLSQLFTEALRDKFSTQTKLTLINKGGDLQIEGAIIGYSTQPVAIQGNETAAMNRLTIAVQVKFTNTLNEEQNFDQTFSKYIDYLSTSNLSSIEDKLIAEINEMLVDEIFNKSVVNW